MGGGLNFELPNPLWLRHCLPSLSIKGDVDYSKVQDELCFNFESADIIFQSTLGNESNKIYRPKKLMT